MPDEIPVPDYGSTPVWSNDRDKWTKELIAKNDGSIDKSLKALFRAGFCSYQQARILAETFAKNFGLTQSEFMQKYRVWRKGGL